MAVAIRILLRKFRVKRPAYLLFICIFQLAIISCTTNEEEISKIIKETVENPNFIPLSEFEINKSRWQASNLNNYQFDFRWICFCEHDYISPVTITVEDGTINNAIYTETQIPVQVNKLDRYKTIDGLFSFIQDAYDKNAYQISINYDPHDGYPFEGSVDYVEMMVDEEKGFEISNLMKLESDENGTWLIGKLPINEISLQITKSIPALVNVTVKGYLSDSCTELYQIKQSREENLVTVEITTRRPKDAFCAQVITEITESIRLEGNFPIGQNYKLIVNGAENRFDL